MTSFYIESPENSFPSPDPEYMAGLLQQSKFDYKEKIDEADIVILYSTAVNPPAIDAFVARVNSIRQEYPYKLIIVAGSIPQTFPEKFKPYALVGTRQIHHIVEAVEETLHNNIIKMLDLSEMPPLDLPKIRKNPFVEIIPLSRASIAITTKQKPVTEQVDSYPKADLVNAAAKAIKEGVTHIWLTSPDCASYGIDLGTNLSALVTELIKIPGEFKIRLDRCNPVNLYKIKEDLFPLFTNEKMCKFIHLSMQTGSNRLLQHMGIGNTKEQSISLVQEIRLVEPHLTLSIDIVVGYPIETDEDHWETLNLLRATSPDVVSISRFWGKIIGARLPPLSEEIIARRTAIITDVVRNISTLRNERWKGWEGNIIINEKWTMPSQWMGINEYYKPILVEGEYKMGDTVKVKITKTGTFELKGEKIG